MWLLLTASWGYDVVILQRCTDVKLTAQKKHHV